MKTWARHFGNCASQALLSLTETEASIPEMTIGSRHNVETTDFLTIILGIVIFCIVGIGFCLTRTYDVEVWAGNEEDIDFNARFWEIVNNQ